MRYVLPQKRLVKMQRRYQTVKLPDSLNYDRRDSYRTRLWWHLTYAKFSETEIDEMISEVRRG